MNIDKEIREGWEAQQFLESPLFKLAIDGIESDLIDKMKQVAMADIDTQHELILSLQVLGNIRRRITTIVQTGKMAEIQKETLLDKAKKHIKRM